MPGLRPHADSSVVGAGAEIAEISGIGDAGLTGLPSMPENDWPVAPWPCPEPDRNPSAD